MAQTQKIIPTDPLTTAITTWLGEQPKYIDELWDELAYLRSQPLKKSKYEKQVQLDRPVAVFSKEERLKQGMGKEITIIFKSSACSWARSKSGGCTMCGYWNDRAPETITEENYWNQFTNALGRYEELLGNPEEKIVFKMFTSGSYCDPKEIALNLQYRILEKLATYPTIKEIVIESRPEYITEKLLTKYREILPNQYLEIGVGLETTDDFVRTNIINKGFAWTAFIKAMNILHQFEFGMKAYLLFKPPFIPEYAALVDIRNSIRKCVEYGVDTISVNPTNIQMHTICNELEKINRFRSPWLYSLLWVLKHSLTNEDLKHTRIICDPSAAGKDRGVHNCQVFDKSNAECLQILHEFVVQQDVSRIPESFSGSCWNSYEIELLLGNL